MNDLKKRRVVIDSIRWDNGFSMVVLVGGGLLGVDTAVC